MGRKIAKAHRAKQTPHGKQTVKKLMAHGTSTNSLELSGDTKLFDRVARKWNVDYAFYQTEPGKYLLFFKSGQADAMTACFSEYSRKVLDKAKSRQPTIPEQMKQAEQQLAKEKPPKEHRAKQTPHGKQTVKKLMAHGTSTNSLELSGDTKLFDRVARKWNVDYAFYQTEPGKYLLFFKSGQADAMTACFSEYSRKVLDKAKSRQPTIPEQMKQAEQQLAKEKPPKEHIKEVSHDR